MLFEYGAPLDLADVGPMENTALHLAARAGAATWMNGEKMAGFKGSSHGE